MKIKWVSVTSRGLAFFNDCIYIKISSCKTKKYVIRNPHYLSVFKQVCYTFSFYCYCTSKIES